MSFAPLDTRQRALRDLRISITDRCNFRCTYCMPKEVFGRDHEFLPKDTLLTFEEIERVSRIAISLGVTKLRITGGEPLLRKDAAKLVARIAALEGLEDLALTTNGARLAEMAPALADAGLGRVTVSLDAIDSATFAQMNDVGFPVEYVLAGIDAAIKAGLGPVKVNMVVQRGVNDHQILPMAEHFRGTPVILRFIEFMDVGNTNGWQLERVVPSNEIHALLHRVHPLQPVGAKQPGEVAKRHRYEDGQGEIGFISSVTRPFCTGCTRLRVSADGQLYTCLFGTEGHDLRAELRSRSSDEDIRDFLATLWRLRDDRYSELRRAATPGLPKVEMSYIGG